MPAVVGGTTPVTADLEENSTRLFSEGLQLEGRSTVDLSVYQTSVGLNTQFNAVDKRDVKSTCLLFVYI